MKKMINIRNSIIIVLCITIIFMGIGFALLSMQIVKENKEEPFFDVSFTKIKEETSVKGGKIDPIATNSITNNGKEINMNFTLNSPYDELAYTIIVKNNGNMKAEIVDIKEIPDYQHDTQAMNSIFPVTVTHSDVIGKILEPNEEEEIKLVVKYNPTIQPIKKEFSYQLYLITASPKE